MTTIRIHFLGGTIGYAGAPDGEPVRLGAEALLAAVPGLDRLPVTLDVHAPEPVPSASLTFSSDRPGPGGGGRVRRRVCGRGRGGAGHRHPGGVGVPPRPAVGPPRAGGADGSDAEPDPGGGRRPANLLAALAVAADERFRELGALVVFADEVHSARTAQKVHTTRPHAFGSPDRGPLGVVVEGRPTVVQHPLATRVTLRPTGPLTARVPVLTVGLDEDPAVLSALAGVADGLVVAALGAVTSPAGWPSRWAALAERMPVVLASRVGAGRVLTGTYHAPGSESDLLGRGLLWSGFLGAAKARVLLVTALACDGARCRRRSPRQPAEPTPAQTG